MNERAIPDALIANQHAASDPAVSAWVSANAGSGKTHVLAQRVIRLLLDGTDPAKILCLTFTRAAAANMANRIFGTLSQWIDLGDAALDKEIEKTGARLVDARKRSQARRLFASALETPGGLKVQTIHGFCTRLLQQFPFEANIAARFRVLEDTQRSQLLEDIRRRVLLEASQHPDSRPGRALAAIVLAASDFAFETALHEAIRERSEIKAWLDHAGSLDAAAIQLSSALGIKPGDTIESVEQEIVEGPHLPTGQWAPAADICARGSKTDKDQGMRLAEALAAAGAARVEAYFSVFLTKDLELRSQVVTGSLTKREPDLARRLSDEQARVHALCEKRRAVLARDRTLALLTLALEVIDRYTAEKNRQGLLDYDDLIARTREMLGRVESAWVHYKLDLGIDHVLIDEAQDTSPQQWDIIRRFVGEFTAGAGARGGLKRSIFAVGDDKQSIFSFQDAEPEAFAQMRRFFETEHRNAGLPFHPIPFNYSFRSAPAVLDAVDAVFKPKAAHAGLTVDPVRPVHEAVRASAPGLVELWPLVRPDEKVDVDPWDQPFDVRSQTSPSVKLARQIATAAKTWLARGDLVGDGDQRHPVRAGDILILVRQRGALFEAVIRLLKQAGIPVAGADRLVLTEHIAVMDLLVLADALLLPADDLALATVLKSPLFGLTEDELFELAHERDGTLLASLRSRRSDLAARLAALTDAAQRLSPFAFYAELLGPLGGRRAFLARLGAEANDAIDEFLNLALDYESRETPSLQGFVAWLRTASAEVKRDMDVVRDEVRVMTVHGAKGLEAPIVILADTTTPPAGPAQYHPRLLALPGQGVAPGTPERLVWMPLKKDDTTPVAAARNAWIGKAENEYRRLLYVAMTRAADRLVVCGAVGEKAVPQGCWYQLVEQGLDATGELTDEPADYGEGTVRRYRKVALDGVAASAAATARGPAKPPPGWLTTKVEAAATRARPLKPSGLDSDPVAAAWPRDNDARRCALARGNAVHRLMQSLPGIAPERRAAAAQRFLARQADGLTDHERLDIASQVLAMLSDRRFAALFAPGSRAEVPIVGRIEGRPVSGVVDRLVVAPESVLIADYKTNRPAPRSLEETVSRHPRYVAQLALYRAVLMRLYPDRPVRAALLWTDIPGLIEIDTGALDDALARTLTSA
jgi:ATP-dependent helicase/nuclease subunit A